MDLGKMDEMYEVAQQARYGFLGFIYSPQQRHL